MKYTYFDVSDEDRSEWENICPAGEFRVFPSGSIPGPFPEDLKKKFVNALVMASGSGDYHFIMINGNRPDGDNIDQQPFGVLFSGSLPVKAVLVRHGSYDEGRTTTMPPDFETDWMAGATDLYKKLSEMPQSESGSIDDLGIASQQNAFEVVVKKLRKSE